MNGWQMPNLADIDEIDLAILRELQDDARQTNRDLATAVHVSTSTSSERVRELRARGIIRGYHAEISLDALRRHVESFRNWVSALPEIMGVFVVSGASDFLLHVGVPDTNALYAFVIDRLTERSEVADVNTSVVYEHIRRPVLEPLDRRT